MREIFWFYNDSLNVFMRILGNVDIVECRIKILKDLEIFYKDWNTQ